MRRIILIMVFSVLAVYGFATHNRAGEIIYQHLGGLRYRITIYTYTDVGPGVVADRPELEIHWGDGDTSVLKRSNGAFNNGELIGNDTKKNIYIGEHNYPGPGVYKLYMQDANRNEGVVNVPGSVNIAFYIESQIIINPFVTVNYNNSPVLLNPPVDYNACVSEVFIHNPGAYDADGDSISYKLVNCKGEDGQVISGYSIPENVSLNSITGDLIWKTPNFIGEFNFAILIEEWRKFGEKYIQIGYVLRDLQVKVSSCPNNKSPEITVAEEACAVANTFLNIPVSAKDINDNKIELTALGGPFKMPESPAYFQSVINYSFVSSKFQWQTKCSHVRLLPYSVLFKAMDNGIPNLAAYKTLQIRVIGPPVTNFTAQPKANSIALNWDKNACSQVVSYKIYRKEDPSGYKPKSCETGVPSNIGYNLIDSLSANQNTTYLDNNNLNGLVPGVKYCYMVVAVFADGSQSIASDEVCTQLKNDVPVITNISILNTSKSLGKVYLAWSKPKELDTIQHRGPFRYLIYSGFENNSSSAVLIDSSQADLNDTIYLHDKLNTQDKNIYYRIDLYNVESGNRYKIGSSYFAPSVFLNVNQVSTGEALKISWNDNTPWKNKLYRIYRKNNSTNAFDFLAETANTNYIDSNLINNQPYCYKVRTSGAYAVDGFVNPILNFSQENCGMPIDNVEPCSPVLDIKPSCENYLLDLNWNNPNNSCEQKDAVKYELYFKPTADAAFEKLMDINSVSDTALRLNLNTSIAGCYYVSALDVYGNKSKKTDTVCVDNCPIYELPNVFTPDNDGKNDFFRPLQPVRYVDAVYTQVFNRWGNLVFESNDKFFQWNGVDKNTNKICSEGVYFYVCQVSEIRLTGKQIKKIQGYVSLYRNSDAVPQTN